MNTKLLSEKALSVINQYENFSIGNARATVPYYNNRHVAARAKLRAQVGKGSPKDIFDEAESIATLEKIPVQNLDSLTFKKFLIDHDLGIDCSGFAYYVLNAESETRGKGPLDKHLSFPLSKGIIGKLRSKIRPAENAGVGTFADNANSTPVLLKDSEPSDMITMVGGPDGGERDHILIVSQIEYQNFIPTTIHYTHAVAWPTDGEYGHGIKHGEIQILDVTTSILEQKWVEAEKTGEENYTFARAQKSTTEIRRLRWF